jgi:hypothetical protein
LGGVTAHRIDHHGNPIGRGNKNPILETRIHQVVFLSGNIAEYSASVITKCIYSQADDDRNQYLLLDEIINWKQIDDAVENSRIYQGSHNGNIYETRTTKG